jgi:AraC-like DNA-binding protein
MERVTEAGAVFETDHRGRSAMHQHRHDLPFVTIVLDGAYVEVQDTVPEVCCGGTIVVHEAGEEHADRFARDTRCLNVELPRVAGAAYPRGAVVLDHQTLRDAVESVVRSFYDRTHHLSHAVRNLHEALLQRPEPVRERPQWLRQAIDEFPWAHPVPFREAAAIAGVHETHFSRAFRRHVGMTANEYRSRARVCLASKLLLTTGSSLARIALSAGFSDQSHLTRVFSQRLGLSPAGYRRTFAR